MTQKNLTTWQFFNLSICAFGLQFASSLQMAGTSSLYKFLGAESSNLSYLWLAAPISGLLIQPIVGQFSDSTATKYGKRMPYIFIWGILGFLALLLLPMAGTVWFAAALMWILSCSHNGCTEALRALIGDITPNPQKARAFALQTIFAGVGAAIAAVLPSLLTEVLHIGVGTQSLNTVPKTLQISFIVAALVLLGSIFWTVYTIREKAFTKINLLRVQKSHLHKNIWQMIYANLREVYQHTSHMPKIMRQLSIVQVFSWFGIFSLWLYFGIAIAQHIYGLSTQADISSDSSAAALLEQATIWTGVCFGIYQFVSVIYAIILPKLTDRYPLKIIHGISLLIGALSIMSCGLIHNHYLLIINMIGVGIMWGSVMTMPYTIIASEVSRAKMGVYMGIFNITITLPQIISGLTLSLITSKIFHNHAMYSIILGGLLIGVSATLLLYQENFLNIRDRLGLCLRKLSPSF